MTIEIITPDKKLFAGEAKVVQLPGSGGSFELLENHAPIVSTLSKGSVRIVDQNDKEHTFDIGGGVIEMNNNKVIILAE